MWQRKITRPSLGNETVSDEQPMILLVTLSWLLWGWIKNISRWQKKWWVSCSNCSKAFIAHKYCVPNSLWIGYEHSHMSCKVTEKTVITLGGDKSARGKCLELKETKLGSRLCMAPLQDVVRIFYSCHGERGGEGSWCILQEARMLWASAGASPPEGCPQPQNWLIKRVRGHYQRCLESKRF